MRPVCVLAVARHFNRMRREGKEVEEPGGGDAEKEE